LEIIGEPFRAGTLYNPDELFEMSDSEPTPVIRLVETMRSTTHKEKAKVVAGAVTAVLATAMLFMLALGLVLSR
jgi:hypothetical protein